MEGSKRLIANLDKEKAFHPLHPKKQADYDQARQVVAKDTVERLQKQTTPLTDAQKQEMADALATLGTDSSGSATPTSGDTLRLGDSNGQPDRAPQPGGTNPRGVELSGGRRSGGPQDSNLVLAGGGDGPHKPLQGGAAASLPPASSGSSTPAAVGQMVNVGAASSDAPTASTGEITSAQPSHPGLPTSPQTVPYNPPAEGAGDASGTAGSRTSGQNLPSGANGDNGAANGDTASPLTEEPVSGNGAGGTSIQWLVPKEPQHLEPTMPYDANRLPSGPPKTLAPENTNPGHIRGFNAENEAAMVLAQHGYEYRQISEANSSPDGKVGGVPDKWDVFAPVSTKSMKGIHDVVTSKVQVQNAPYVIVRIEPGGQNVSQMTEYFKNHAVEGLKQLFVIKDGQLYIIR